MTENAPIQVTEGYINQLRDSVNWLQQEINEATDPAKKSQLQKEHAGAKEELDRLTTLNESI